MPKVELAENQRIGVKLEMESYLINDIKGTIIAGKFLNELFTIYNIKKTKFAEYLGIENESLHALTRVN